MLALDKWTGNCNGRHGRLRSRAARCGNYRQRYQDQGYCFNAGEWTFPDTPLVGSTPATGYTQP